MADGTSWMLSPVYESGYTGHSVVVHNGMWYDSAHNAAKSGTGVRMDFKKDWQAGMPYAWKVWHCANLRQLFMPWSRGYVCNCGVRVNRATDAEKHPATKKHKAWLRKTQQ